MPGERGERVVERGPGDPRGLVGVQHPEPRVETGRDGVRGEEPSAEAVDGRDRRGLAGPCRLLQARLPGGVGRGRRARSELDPDAPPHLRGRLLGEREGEDPLGLDAVGVDRLAVALDEDAGLAGAGAGLEEDVAVAVVDRRPLLVGRRDRGARSATAGTGSGARRLHGLEAELLVLLGGGHARISSSSSSSSSR